MRSILLLMLAFTASITNPGGSTPNAPVFHHPHDVVNDLDLVPGYPDDPTIFVASAGSMNLFLRSNNGGYSWTNRRSGMRGAKIFEFVPTPDWSESKTGYAVVGSGGLQRTVDGGQTWEPPMHAANLEELCIAPEKNADGSYTLFFGGGQSLWRSDDGGASSRRIGSNQFNDTVRCIAVPPTFAQSGVVAVGAENNYVHLSSDRGQSWSRTEIPGSPMNVVFSPSYATDTTIWVATHGAGVMVSNDGGKSFRQSSTGIEDIDVNDVAVAPTYPACKDLFAATRDDGVYRSIDGGGSWELTRLRAELTFQTDNHYTRLTISPRYPEDPTICCGAYEGFYISEDSGASWREGNINPTQIGRKLHLSTDFKNDKSILIATYGVPALYSTDAGESWELRSTNMDSRSTYSVAFSPHYAEDNLLITGSGWSSFRRSTDRGQTWKRYEVAPLTGDEFKPWEIRQIKFSPGFRTDRTMFAVSPGGLFRSDDAGISWSSSNVPSEWTWRVEMSPNWTQDQILFVAGLTLHRSTDGGKTWSDQLTWGKFMGLKCAPDFAETGEAYAICRHNGYSFSTDHGVTWTRNRAAFDGFSPTKMKLFPDFEKTGAMAVSTLAGGIFTSADRGRTWARAFPLGGPADTVFDFEISPDFETDGTVFAATFEGILKSTDRGKTWKVTTDIAVYDETRAPWIGRGSWHQHRYAEYFDLAASRSNEMDAEKTLPFTGTGVRLYGAKGPEHGIAEIRIDGKLVKELDCYAPEHECMAVLYEDMDLEWGFHSLTVRVSGKKNPESSDNYVTIDAASVAYRGPHDGRLPVFADRSRVQIEQMAPEDTTALDQRFEKPAGPDGGDPAPTGDGAGDAERPGSSAIPLPWAIGGGLLLVIVAFGLGSRKSRSAA